MFILGGEDGVSIIRIGKMYCKADEEERDHGNIYLFTTELLLAFILALAGPGSWEVHEPSICLWLEWPVSYHLWKPCCPPHKSLSPGMNHVYVCLLFSVLSSFFLKSEPAVEAYVLLLY